VLKVPAPGDLTLTESSPPARPRKRPSSALVAVIALFLVATGFLALLVLVVVPWANAAGGCGGG
jgi:hypothetical protein